MFKVIRKKSSKKPTCRSCGQQIKWMTTTKGKKMPVDPDELDIDFCEPDDIVVDCNGRISEVQNADTTAEPFRMSHFATCPEADSWRHG